LFGANTTARDQRQLSTFDKYENAIQIRQIDWVLVQANLEVVRNWIDGRYEFIETPVLTFNSKTRRVEAFATVNSDELGGLPIEDIKVRLYFTVIQTGAAVQQFVREFDTFRGTEFYMQFRGISFKAAKAAGREKRTDLPISIFAEFRNGEIALH
jgi:hypothetical protein